MQFVSLYLEVFDKDKLKPGILTFFFFFFLFLFNTTRS